MAEQKLPTIEEVFSWMRKLYDESYSGLTKTEKSEQHMYGTMVTTPNDKKFIVRMLDETSQVRDTQKLARRVKDLIDQYGIPKFLGPVDHSLFWMYQQFAYTPLFNWAAVAQVPDEVFEAAANCDKYVAQSAPVKNGRIELALYIKEQSISNEYHRYGSQIEVPEIE